jgi:hypothetical protein
VKARRRKGARRLEKRGGDDAGRESGGRALEVEAEGGNPRGGAEGLAARIFSDSLLY